MIHLLAIQSLEPFLEPEEPPPARYASVAPINIAIPQLGQFSTNPDLQIRYHKKKRPLRVTMFFGLDTKNRYFPSYHELGRKLLTEIAEHMDETTDGQLGTRVGMPPNP